MNDSHPCQRLVDLREQAGLTQKQVADIIGVRRKTYVDWELGNVSAQQRHRNRIGFIRYLLFSLDLRHNLPTFEQVWEDIPLAQWDWNDFTVGELALIELAQRPEEPQPDIPLLPPHLLTHTLVGREDLLADIKRRLHGGDTVALTGIPGVGKTALTVALAEDPDIRDRFKDGILWASLGPRPDVLSSLGQWASALGRDLSDVTEIRTRAQALRNIIGSRHMLLIIDDAWEPIPALQLKCGGPNCAHLVTTRIHSVLAELPNDTSSFTIPELGTEPGFELLCQLAPRACKDDASGTRELVDVVGGLPLALVLLGGYLASPEHLYFDAHELAEPGQRLQLARARLGAVTDQSMTLQEVIDLSLESLPQSIIRTYHALGAFASKPAWFHRHAAETVARCAASDLALLVDRSLLEPGTAERLALHQVLADHARDQMEPDTRERHRDYYLRQAIAHRDNWRQIDADYQQIRWAWLRQTQADPDDELLYAFVNALDRYQERRGLLEDRIDWSSAALILARKNEQGQIMASLLARIASSHSRLGDRIVALEQHWESFKIREQLEDALGQALQNIAGVYHAMGYFDDAADLYRHALEEVRQADNEEMEATILSDFGRLLVDIDEYEDALDRLHESLSLRQRLHDVDGKVNTLLHIASAYIEMGDYDRAVENLYAALEIAQESGNQSVEGSVRHDLGVADTRQGNLQAAEDHYRQALDIFQQTKDKPGEARCRFGLGKVYQARGELAASYEIQYQALQHYHDALDLQREVADRVAQMHTLGFIGMLHANVGNYEDAIRYYEESLTLTKEFPNRRDEAALLQKMGEAAYEMGQLDLAESSFRNALNLVSAHGTLADERTLRILMAATYGRFEQIDLAIEHLSRGLELDQYLNHPDLEKDQRLMDTLQGKRPA